MQKTNISKQLIKEIQLLKCLLMYEEQVFINHSSHSIEIIHQIMNLYNVNVLKLIFHSYKLQFYDSEVIVN